MYGYSSYGSAPYGVAQAQAGTAPIDTTAPTLTAASAVATGQATASWSVTVSEAATLYAVATTSATETASQVKAGAAAEVSAGTKTGAFSGLTPDTTYYPHFIARDAAGNESTVANGAAFKTEAVPVVPAPGEIDASKVPADRRVLFEGSKRVVSFEGSIRKVRF